MTSLAQVEKFWGKVCFDPKFVPQGRFRTYRNLVFNGMQGAVRNICPVAREILSEAEWDQLFWEFLKKSTPRTVILREVALEFAAFLKSSRHPLLKKYPYLGELIEYEAAEIVMRFAPEDDSTLPPGKLRLNPAHYLAKYRWPVHFLRKEFSDPKQLKRGEYHLLLWRNPESLQIHFMEVNLLVASLITRLKSKPLTPDILLGSVAKEHQIPSSREFLVEGRAHLQELIQKKVLLTE